MGSFHLRFPRKHPPWPRRRPAGRESRHRPASDRRLSARVHVLVGRVDDDDDRRPRRHRPNCLHGRRHQRIRCPWPSRRESLVQRPVPAPSSLSSCEQAERVSRCPPHPMPLQEARSPLASRAPPSRRPSYDGAGPAESRLRPARPVSVARTSLAGQLCGPPRASQRGRPPRRTCSSARPAAAAPALPSALRPPPAPSSLFETVAPGPAQPGRALPPRGFAQHPVPLPTCRPRQPRPQPGTPPCEPGRGSPWPDGHPPRPGQRQTPARRVAQ